MGYLNALLPAGLALAGTLEVAQGPRQDAMTELDTDRNGSISRAEASANPELDARFQVLDRNTNGALEPAEFARFETEPASGPQAPGFRMPPTPR